MKLPIPWLKRYVDMSLSAAKLEELFTMSGTKVESVEGDVLTLEITTNRPDCLSLLGLARELSALTGKPVRAPKISKENKKTGMARFSVRVEDAAACPMYTARLLSGVSVKPSPPETQKLLELSGARPINNAVDATNFVLFEMGQPMHAFDFDKLVGGAVIVRRAKKGEKILAIDGVEYALDENTLVIADAEKPVAIAGVIGGKLTEVTASTKNILLESAQFDPRLVRRSVRKYKISTESSYRFERSVDPNGVAAASARAAQLITEWGGGEDVSGLVQKRSRNEVTSPKITLHGEILERLLGLRVPLVRAKAILLRLGLRVTAKNGALIVDPGTARGDLKIEADLVEEVLRIEGFDKVPPSIPVTRHNTEAPIIDRSASRALNLKKTVAAMGFNEVITYNLLSAKTLKESGFELSDASRIVNAVSAEQEYYRPSLLTGMLQALQFNVNRKASGLKFFEIGKRFANGSEELVLALALYGRFEDNWRRSGDASFFDLKGVIETLLHSIGAAGSTWTSAVSDRLYDNAAELSMGGIPVGTLGEVSRNVLKDWDLPHAVYFAEIQLENILAEAMATRVKTVPRFPSVRRDLAILVDEKLPVEILIRTMRTAGGAHLQDVRLFDVYAGKNIASGKRSLAFSLAYQKENGTFTDDEIQAMQTRVGEALKRDCGVEFR